MKRQRGQAALVLGVLWTVAGVVEAHASDLVANRSFEQPIHTAGADGWRGDAKVYAIDTEVRHRGQSSLRFVNDQADRYRLCSQKVALKPGWKVRFSAWVKTKGLQGDETGATICLEWRDAGGKWVGGSYPSGIKGTKDWTPIDETVRLPENAASVTLSCYVRRGMTGTAWFDDVELVRVTDPPMEVLLRTPVYRGWITAQGPEEVRARVRLRLGDYDLQPKDVRVDARLRDATGRVRQEVSAGPKEAPEFEVSVPVRGLAPGTYDLEMRLTTCDGKELQKTHDGLRRVPDDHRARCRIDEHRRLLVDGRPFFPLGMYFTAVKEQDLKIYGDSKFNCLMPYGSPTREQMDLVQRYGLKVIYSIKDWYAGSSYCPKSIRDEADEEPLVRARVRQFRDHPALLAWYLNDELSLKYVPRLEAHQRWVAEEDPDHPTWSVLYQVHDVAGYLRTFDVIGTDPYPIGRKPASMAADWTAETFRHVAQSRPMWQVPQAHNWDNYAKDSKQRNTNHTPTFDEKRSMAWQCICEGATGLVFYSWYDVQRNPDVSFATQWADLKQIAAEIDRMTTVLLSTDSVPSIVAHGQAADTAAPKWLHWIARNHSGKLWIAAVNDGDGEGEVSFSLPSPSRSIRVAGENREIRPDGKAFRDSLRPLAVHLYEIVLDPNSR